MNPRGTEGFDGTAVAAKAEKMSTCTTAKRPIVARMLFPSLFIALVSAFPQSDRAFTGRDGE